MDMRNIRDMFKIKVEYEGQTLIKQKGKGKKGLRKIFNDIDSKLFK